MDDLDQAGDGAAHGLAVAGVEVGAQAEVGVAELGVVELAQIAQGLGQVVDHEAVVVREELIAHLGDFPARQVAVQPVDEGHVIADHIGHRREQMPCLHHHVDRLLGVAEHGDAGVAGEALGPALELARFAVGLHRGDDLLGHLLEVGHLVEADHVPDRHHPLHLAVHVAEEVGHGGGAGEQGGVGRELLHGKALAGAARAQLHQVVVALAEGDQPQQEQQLEPLAPSRRARSPSSGSADRSTRRCVNWVRSLRYSSRLKRGQLDRRELADREGCLARRSHPTPPPPGPRPRR